MPHPDEGTIHAWLDGALSPADATAFESRVASDPALREAVAEARGLIAASARILGALDEVPGNVVPKQAPTGTLAGNVAGAVAGDVSSLNALRARAAAQSAAARAPRRWRAQSWAAAAMIVVAAGVGVLWKSGGEPVAPADLAVTQATRSEPAPAAPKPAEVTAPAAPVTRGQGAAVAQSAGRAAGGAGAAGVSAGAANAVAVVPAPTAGSPSAVPPSAGVSAPSVASDLEGRRREAGFAAKKESAVAAQDLVVSKATADAKAPSKQGEALDAAAPMAKVAGRNAPARDRAVAAADEAHEKVAPVGELKARAEVTQAGAVSGAAVRATMPAAAPAMAKLSATVDSTRQRGSRPVPATAILTEEIPDPRASAIGCRTVRVGEWSPALTGVRTPVLLMLDSQRVAVGWRRARPLMQADERAYVPGTWHVERDSARIGLPDAGDGLALRAAISMRSGAGTATLLGAKGDVRARATASWSVEACGPR